MISVCTERRGSLPLFATVQNGPQLLLRGAYTTMKRIPRILKKVNAQMSAQIKGSCESGL